MRTRLSAWLVCAAILCSLFSCSPDVIQTTPASFLADVNALVADDYGILTMKQDNLIPRLSVAPISDEMTLSLYAQEDTGLLQEAILTLSLSPTTDDLAYDTFSYFFLILLKAYDESMTIAQINTIHDTLTIGAYEPGTELSIGYGSSTYYYTVTDTEAVFRAKHAEPAAAVG